MGGHYTSLEDEVPPLQNVAPKGYEERFVVSLRISKSKGD